jgi:hypothetical protein
MALVTRAGSWGGCRRRRVTGIGKLLGGPSSDCCCSDCLALIPVSYTRQLVGRRGRAWRMRRPTTWPALILAPA